MTRLHIRADEGRAAVPLQQALRAAALELASPDRIDSTSDDDFALALTVADISAEQAERFVVRMLDLSYATGLSFTICAVMDEDATQKLRAKLPLHLSCTEHVVHVRPGEGPVLRAYFRFLFLDQP